MKLTPAAPGIGRSLYTSSLAGKKPESEAEARDILTHHRASTQRTARHVALLPESPLSADTYVDAIFDGVPMARAGRGRAGGVYSFEVTEKSKAKIREVFSRLGNVIVGAPVGSLTKGGRVAIKVSPLPDHARKKWREYGSSRKFDIWHAHLMTAANDASVHHELATFRGIPLLGNGAANLDIKDHVPTFYFAGVDTQMGVYLTVMSFVDGSVARKSQLTYKAVAKIERAFLALHAAGYAHADAHENNVFLTKDDGPATLIDFGYAMRLPQRLADRATTAARKAYETLKSTGRWPVDVIDNVWYGSRGIGAHVDQVMKSVLGGGLDMWYNPNGKFVRWMWASFDDGAKLNAARMHVWGLKIGTSQKSRRPNSRLKVISPKSGRLLTPMNKKTIRRPNFPPLKRPELNYGNL